MKRTLTIILVGWLTAACSSTQLSGSIECEPDLSLYDKGFQKPNPSVGPPPFVTSELLGFSIGMQIRSPARASAGEANLNYWMSGAEDLDYDVLVRWGTGTPSQGSEIAMMLFIDGILMPFAVEESAGAIFRQTLAPGSSMLLHVHVPSIQIADGAHLVGLIAFPTSGGGMLHAVIMNVLYKNSTTFDLRPPAPVQTLARYPDRSGRGLIDPNTHMPAPFLEVAPSSQGDLPVRFAWETTSIFRSCPDARQDVLFAAILDFDRQVELGELGIAPRATLGSSDRIQASAVLHGLPVNDGQNHQLWFLTFSGYGHHFEIPWGAPTVWALDAINGKLGLIRW